MRKSNTYRYVNGILCIGILCILLYSCSMKSKQLTISKTAFAPKMCYDGKNFCIAYPQYTNPTDLYVCLLKIDSKGNQLKTKMNFSKLYKGQSKYLLDIIYNEDYKEYAVVLTDEDGSKIKAFLFDLNLNQVGNTLEIGSLFPSTQPDKMIDLSLTWNEKTKKYAVSYILEKHPYVAVNDATYIYRFDINAKPYMTFFPLITCNSDCSGSSIIVDPQTGYYISATFCGPDVYFCTFDGNITKKEYKIMSGWQPSKYGKKAIRIIYDEVSKDYIVVAINDTELAYQIIKSNETPVSKVFVKGKGYSEIFSIDKLGTGSHSFFICAAKNNQVVGWPIYTSGHEKVNLLTINSPSTDPAIVILNGLETYITWVESGNLFFGQSELNLP
ncbi:MAG: hypothetical protein JW894_13300 [Bacteroidales bacterium]|nr:hypothetical protein [Bacteroidales bacterium]